MTDYRLSVPIFTPRLIIRDAARADMRGWSSLYRSPKVRLHLNGPLKRSAQDWWRGHQQVLADVDRPLSVVLPKTNELVGGCGFFSTTQPAEWEAWLLLRSKFWENAMGAEVTSALVAVAFESFAAQRVIGIVDPTNHASLAMIKKLGFFYMCECSGTSLWQRGHHVYGVERHTHKPTAHRTLLDKATQRQ